MLVTRATEATPITSNQLIREALRNSYIIDHVYAHVH